MAVSACAYVIGKPAFDAAAVVVVSPPAFFLEILPGLKPVDIEITDIRPYLAKLPDQFFIFGLLSKAGVLFGSNAPYSIQKKRRKNNGELRSVFDMTLYYRCGRI